MSDQLDLRWDDTLSGDVETFRGGGTVLPKSELLGKPFLIGRVEFHDGDFNPFVSLTAVNRENFQFVVNDGSSGIYRQIVNWLHDKELLDPAIENPDMQSYDVRLFVPGGLRVSRYEYTDEKGKKKPSETYYLA